jgi:hypothetical protein
MLSLSKIDDWEHAVNAIPYCLWVKNNMINATINSRLEQKIG